MSDKISIEKLDFLNMNESNDALFLLVPNHNLETLIHKVILFEGCFGFRSRKIVRDMQKIGFSARCIDNCIMEKIVDAFIDIKNNNNYSLEELEFYTVLSSASGETHDELCVLYLERCLEEVFEEVKKYDRFMSLFN